MQKLRSFPRKLARPHCMIGNYSRETLCPATGGAGIRISEVYADRRRRRPAAERAPIDALDARAADGVAAVDKRNGL